MHFSYPEKPITIGDHIRRKRLDLNLLQRDIAKIFEVSVDCVTYWENGRSAPQVIFYPRIIEFLGYSPLEFDETVLSGQIKAYRYKYGITSRMLGNMLKVNPSTITEWENGSRIPNQKHLLKLKILFYCNKGRGKGRCRSKEYLCLFR